MKHVIDYLKDTRAIYARLRDQDAALVKQNIAGFAAGYGKDNVRERLEYRREFVDQLDDAIETLEGE